jgi:hypothetical protein
MRLTFTADSNGRFDFSEIHLTRIAAELRANTGPAGPTLPETVVDAACAELTRSIQDLAASKGIQYHEAASRIVRERPALVYLTRAAKARDDDRNADATIRMTE